MTQKNPNPYANYGFTGQQAQTPYYGNVQQGGQQPMYQQMPPMQQMPPQQQMQIPPQMQVPSGTGFQGGPLEASGGLLVPVTPTTHSKTPNVAANVPGMLPIDQAYIENLLRINKGRLATVYMTFRNNPEWPA
ncbi:MAG: spore coat protein GerQ, partial [Lactococcus garvieae]